MSRAAKAKSPASKDFTSRLAIRGIKVDIGKEHADTFRNFQAPDLRCDIVIATALRDSASNPSKSDAADGNRPTTTFFKK